MDILQTVSLTKVFTTATNLVPALDQVNLRVEQGEFVAIVGTSGSGKTTLLNLLGALDTPTSGTVTINGVVLEALTAEERTEFRRMNIGFIFQSYNLIPVLNVLENIILPAKLNGDVVDEERLQQLAARLGIADKLYDRPQTLSGGQQQRVAIARALYTRPQLILADEPTGNLDSRTTTEVMELLRNMAVQYHQTLIVVTHDERVAALADRVIRIEDGQVCQ